MTLARLAILIPVLAIAGESPVNEPIRNLSTESRIPSLNDELQHQGPFSHKDNHYQQTQEGTATIETTKTTSATTPATTKKEDDQIPTTVGSCCDVDFDVTECDDVCDALLYMNSTKRITEEIAKAYQLQEAEKSDDCTDGNNGQKTKSVIVAATTATSTSSSVYQSTASYVKDTFPVLAPGMFLGRIHILSPKEDDSPILSSKLSNALPPSSSPQSSPPPPSSLSCPDNIIEIKRIGSTASITDYYNRKSSPIEIISQHKDKVKFRVTQLWTKHNLQSMYTHFRRSRVYGGDECHADHMVPYSDAGTVFTAYCMSRVPVTIVNIFVSDPKLKNNSKKNNKVKGGGGGLPKEDVTNDIEIPEFCDPMDFGDDPKLQYTLKVYCTPQCNDPPPTKTEIPPTNTVTSIPSKGRPKRTKFLRSI